MIHAEVIVDSINPWGQRVTTEVVTFPRCILSEVNTHRSHSKSSASSRAVPVRRMLEQVETNPFIPMRWQSAQAGMQGGADLDPERAEMARQAWLIARDHAVLAARVLLDVHGLHKTMPNRLLEPFMWHTAILTATDDGWTNLFRQRCSPLAEIHMQATADAMRAAYDASAPIKVDFGGWHLPYIADDEHGLPLDAQQKLSAARCARVSYLTHDGRRDHDEDLRLFEKLATADPIHASPMEHQATPNQFGDQQLGNLAGWSQLRHRVEAAA